MTPRFSRLLTRLYPKAWRERYGDEFEAHLENTNLGIHAIVNTAKSALFEHVSHIWRRKMDTIQPSFVAIVRRPIAFLPMAMSLAALAVVLGHIAVYGAAREADEGAAAHIWQLLMAGQLPILAFFAIKWLPKAPKLTHYVLAMQAGAVAAALAPVFYFNL